MLSTAAPATPAEVERLVEKARTRHLADDPYWRTLLHFRPGLAGTRSLVDDPDFFLAPNGKHDAAAELEADLRGFFSPPGKDLNKHPSSRFPARQDWLVKQLGIDPASLPVQTHPLLDQVLREVKPSGISLVFPAAYMNSPASLFGHTLITIRGDIDSELMNHAVSYAALTNETNGIVFAVKGIIGSYPGYMSVLPYYRKVQQYNDMSQRDLWEYRLDLTPEEARRLTLHVWELRDMDADYYFFDENCAYVLLFLLDAARPGLHLTDDARPWVIPLDTVRLVVDAGLVEDVVYRPSKSTHLNYLADHVPVTGQRQAWALSHGTMSPTELPPATDPAARALVLDLAVEDLQIRHGYHKVKREEYVPRFRKLLVARSQVSPPEGYLPPIPTPARPDSGHGSGRLGLAAGVDEDRAFSELSIRPAYHDLLDPDPGYLNGSEIQFMGVTGRWYEGSGDFELTRVDAITIRSLSPRSRFHKPISWKVETGLVREPTRDDERHRQAYLNTGGGWAWAPWKGAIAYALMEADVRVGRIEQGYAVGAGGSAGLLTELGDRWKALLYGRTIAYGLGDTHEVAELGLGARYTLTANMALRLDVAWRHAWSDSYPSARLGWYVYF